MTKHSDIKSWLLIFCLLASTFITSGCNEALKATSSNTQIIKDLLPQATSIIRQGLDDQSPQIRTSSIEVVADTKLVEFMPKVKKLLKDDYVPVRFAAAQAIGDTEYFLAKPALEHLVKIPEENTKIATAYALYKLGSKKHLEIVRKALTSPDQTVRANAALLLGKSGDRDQLKLLYWSMKDKNSSDKVRFQAAESIAMLGEESIFRKLWAILISVYADDRVLAIKAMGALGTDQAKDVLITKLDDEVMEVRLAAAEQLGALGYNIGEQVVLDVFEKSLEPNLDSQDIDRIHARAAFAIGQIKSPRLVKYLPVLIKDDSKLVRIAACKAVFQVDRSN